MNNLSLTGSFIIGGLVLITLMYVFYKFTSRTQDMAASNFTQISMASVGRVMDYDFDKIGYRVSTGTKISAIDTFSISFRADLDNNGITDSVFYFRQTDSTGTYMVRGTFETSYSEWQVAVSTFIIEGLDSIGNCTYTPSDIRSVAITVVLDNSVMSSDSTENIGSYWKRRYFPKNL